MNNMTNVEIVELLILKAQFSKDEAEYVVKKVENMRKDIKDALLNWLKVDKYSEIIVEGFTADGLLYSHGLEPVASFLTLDWLAREPAKAKKSLERGYDEVYINGEMT